MGFYHRNEAHIFNEFCVSLMSLSDTEQWDCIHQRLGMEIYRNKSVKNDALYRNSAAFQ